MLTLRMSLNLILPEGLSIQRRFVHTLSFPGFLIHRKSSFIREISFAFPKHQLLVRSNPIIQFSKKLQKDLYLHLEKLCWFS